MDDAQWNAFREKSEAILGEPLSDQEVRIVRLTLAGNNFQDVAETLGLPVETVRECTESLFVRLQAAAGPPSWDPSPNLPPAASAALAVPLPQDIAKHVGREMLRTDPRPA